MTDNVTRFPGITLHPLPVEVVLEKAKGRGISRVIVVGVDDDENLWVSGSHSGVADNVMMLIRAQGYLVQPVTEADVASDKDWG